MQRTVSALTLLKWVYWAIGCSFLFWPNVGLSKKDQHRPFDIREAKGGKNKNKPSNPCKPLQNACRQAGFKKNGPNGKDLNNDCIDQFLMGYTVPKVHVTQGVIMACKHHKHNNDSN